MSLERFLWNVIADDPGGLSEFYKKLFGLTEVFHSDWYVVLAHPEKPFEFGFLLRGHDVEPPTLSHNLGGSFPTFVVTNVDEATETALGLGGEVVHGPEDLFYGQRRVIIRDPNGTIIDISSPSP